MEQSKKQVITILTGQALQGLLERESNWSSKLISDVFYKKLAKHAVNLAIECYNEIEEKLKEKDEA